jgi:hypothetical protein
MIISLIICCLLSMVCIFLCIYSLFNQLSLKRWDISWWEKKYSKWNKYK